MNAKASIPVEEWHEAVLLFSQPQDPDAMPDMASGFGFRMVKVRPTSTPSGFEGYSAYKAFVNAEMPGKTPIDLRDGVGAFSVAVEQEPEGFMESKALDALWLAQGAGDETGPVKIEGEAEVKIPWTEIAIGGAVALVAVGALVHWSRSR